MTLVPIIYTSLLIFSAILLFVLIVSYISFKAKGGDKRALEVKRKTVQIQPSYVSHQSAPVVNYKAAPIIQQKTTQLNYSSKSNPVQSSVKVNQEQLLSNKFEQKYFDRNENRKANSITREDRISILNSPISYSYKSKPLIPKHTEKISNRLPDLNMLHYYSDNTGSDFITLSA